MPRAYSLDLRQRLIDAVEAMPMHGHAPARLLPHKHRLLRLMAEEPDFTLRQIGERLVNPTPFSQMAAKGIDNLRALADQ